MGKTVRDVLVRSLSNLEKKSLKKFRRKLNDFEIKKEFNKIPRGELEDADPDDVTDLIRRYYKDSYGVEVTLAVLEAIDENKEAETLRSALQEVSGWGSQDATNGADNRADNGAPPGAPAEKEPQRTPEDEEHFVVRHYVELIQRVTLVAPILDDLFQWKLLTPEGYNRVRSMATSQEKMRVLMGYVVSWGDVDKDRLLQSLRKHNAPLIRDLEGR
ncbi:apoptosis-associated speck-like protein containing a CARD [Dendropsophus ebraccatus]|uniref:apoptosis-associated speck-like protein containing a CARD n=1 Tax=Dendropsophus ebraccatus TaxID=150705 RepID=UPI003831C738